MEKEYLLDLVTRMNTREKDFKISSETTSRKATREAETLTDPAAFPILREIVAENEGKTKAKRERRQDLKITAKYAIQFIREREEAEPSAPKEVTP